MDREQVRQWEAQCIQEQAPACSTACPMHVDARKLTECVRKADFKGGLAILAGAVPLPLILANICDHPCQQQCRRNEVGEAIRIQSLERACAEFGGAVKTQAAFARKSQRIAIAGGELSGVSAALFLAGKGYDVTIFETAPVLLNSLRGLEESLLPTSAITADLDALLQLNVNVNCDSSVLCESGSSDLDSLVQEFDAVYIEAREEYALHFPTVIDPLTLSTCHSKVFAGSALNKLSPIFQVYEGSVAAISIDRFLQGASLTANRENQGPYRSRLFVNTKGEIPSSAVQPAVPNRGYSREEAQQEAERCFPCQCMECVKVCEYLKQYGSYPKRYVREIYNNECIVMGMRKSNRMINSCALCGLCTTVCPESLSMADVCLDARRGMVQKGKMPPSAHDFALRDMAFSTSDAFALVRHQPGFDSSRFAFLPGCQLSASSPEHVTSCYAHLRDSISGGVGLILGCCGAPALWAGEESFFKQALQAMTGAWEHLGRPQLITACSSCYRVLRDHLPQIPIEPLWRHIHLERISPAPVSETARTLAIHDPCSTRNMPEVEDGVRNLLSQLGIAVSELNERGQSTCCGYGGLMQFANPELADKTVVRRAQESSADFLTYCAMCRDRFAHNGKRALHILDLVFGGESGADPAARLDPGFSRRQENRAHLKTRLLRDLWGEQEVAVEPSLQLVISEEVRALLEKRMILIEDVCKVVAHAEETREKFEDPATGHILASYRPSCVTYWVEYSIGEKGFVVHSAYSHRMQVI